jgi:predicted DNA-binding antitoxin AbrB/MazE fold protein
VGFGLFKVIRVRYEKGVLRPLEPIELKEGEEVLVRIESLRDRRRIVEEFYGKRGPARKELLDEFMLEAEAQ